MFLEEAEGDEIQSTDEVLAFRSDLYFVKVKRQEHSMQMQCLGVE